MKNLLFAAIVLLFASCAGTSCMTFSTPTLSSEGLAKQRSYGLSYVEPHYIWEDTTVLLQLEDTLMVDNKNVKVWLAGGLSDTIYEIVWFRETSKEWGVKTVSYNFVIEDEKGHEKFLYKNFQRIHECCQCDSIKHYYDILLKYPYPW